MAGDVVELLRHAFTPFAVEFIHVTNEVLQHLLIVRGKQTDQVVQLPEEKKAGFVDPEDQIDQFRLDRSFVGFDHVRQVELRRHLVPDRR